MPPAGDDAGRGTDLVDFGASASTSIVTFTAVPDARHQNDDRTLDRGVALDGRTVLRMGFRLRCQPPLLLFRFNVNVFGHGNVKTALYFDVPRHHILSLEHTTHADAHEIPELQPDDVRCLGGGAMRLRVLLDRPGHLVVPRKVVTLKDRSQSTLQALTRLAATLEFVLFIPRKTLSEGQIQCLQQNIALSASAHDEEQQEREHGHWLGGLYGGSGGRIQSMDAASPPANAATTIDSASTPSESEESTVATATPPAYRRSAGVQGRDAAAVVAAAAAATSLDEPVIPEPNNAATLSPPPYTRPESVDDGIAPAADAKDKGLRKRPHDDTHRDVRYPRIRLSSPPTSAGGVGFEKQETGTQPQHAVDLVLSKLDQIMGSFQRSFQRLEHNVEVLNAEVSTMRRAQQEMQATLEDVVAGSQRHKEQNRDLARTCNQLESETMGLTDRCERLEDTHGEILDTLEKMEDKYQSIELVIEDQVHDMVKARLTAALETM